MNRIELDGCRTEPLMSYLKALGVLMVLTHQKDKEARGAWVDGRFVLSTKLNREELVLFLAEDYQPTPITSPWLADSGYYTPNKPNPTLTQIKESVSLRLAPYRQTIQCVFELFPGIALTETLKDEQKFEMLQKLRSKMPECYLPWLDAAVVLLSKKAAFPPLLGSGGNDGRLEFSVKFMERLLELGFQDQVPDQRSEEYLKNTLFAIPCRNLGNIKVGQFNPGRAGGPNSTQGFEGDALDNPWDFLLMLEGALLFTGTASRKLASQSHSQPIAIFPFRMKAVAAEASLVAKDAQEPKGEMWLPLWPLDASLGEITYLLNEGRADIGDKAALSGVDFARAIASLGIDRGIEAFQRMGFLKRNGMAYLVTPLGVFPVREQKEVDLVRQMDGWIHPLGALAKDSKSPARFATALRRWDSAVLALCRQGGPARFADLITSLGDIFSCMAKGPKYCEGFRGLPNLSQDWLDAANDNSPEYRLARCLAGVYDPSGKIGPMAIHALPMTQQKVLNWCDNKPLDYTWTAGPLAQNLALALKRRIMDALRKNLPMLPLETPFPAHLNDVILFLNGQTDDDRIERLMLGMLAIRQKSAALTTGESNLRPHPEWESIPFAFKLIRPLFASKTFQLHGLDIPSAPQSAILVSLMANNPTKALDLAARRLRHLGLKPLGSSRTGKHADFSDVAGVDPVRLAASCFFGLLRRDHNGLLYRVVRVPNEQLQPL